MHIMEGKGKCCSHAGAILWKIEYAVKTKLTGAAGTDEEYAWNKRTTTNLLHQLSGTSPSKNRIGMMGHQ
jgi:hypothetical protein